jgi:hypothetical protein
MKQILARLSTDANRFSASVCCHASQAARAARRRKKEPEGAKKQPNPEMAHRELLTPQEGRDRP